jgi:SAM-dependent methyltransferase
LERHRLLVLVDRKEDFFTGKEVLHFAPEIVLARLIRTRAQRYVSADFTPGRADWVLNIERIDQPDDSWDAVVCCHVLEHVNEQAALAELHRILRKGAQLVTMVPIIEGWETTYENPAITTEQDRQAHFGQFDHVRYYGSDIRDRLKKAGFDIREYTAYGSDAVKYGLLKGEKLFVCTKRK